MVRRRRQMASLSVEPSVRPARIGRETTVRAVIGGRQDKGLALRWTWDDGRRSWHADTTARPSADAQTLEWHGIFEVAGVHRIDLQCDPSEGPSASAFLVALPARKPRLVISGQAILERLGHKTKPVPIGLVIPANGWPDVAVVELRWQDEGLEVRSQEVSWVLDRPDGWIHVGGTAVGPYGTSHPFRAHFRLGAGAPPKADRGEIRLYPPGANPGVDPPQRVIAGPIQALRRRGSITT